MPIPLRLAGLTSKREDNCNVMIEGPVDHGLHVTYQLPLFVLKSYMPQPYLHHPRYEFFFVLLYRRYNFISPVPTWLPISTSFFWSRSPTCCMWVKQAVCFEFWLIRKNYLQINVFSNLVVVERKEYPHILQRKAIGGGATSKVVRRQLAERGQAWLLGGHHELLPSRPGGRVILQCFAVRMQE